MEKKPEKPEYVLAKALEYCLVSPNECDRNLEAANVVDGLFAIARAIHDLADAIRGDEV